MSLQSEQVCPVCFRHCRIPEGKTGFCGGRSCLDGTVIPSNYGQVTALALDSVEKKPLARFYPGSRILSVGSYGCNLACPFCQNHEISMGRPGCNGGIQPLRTESISPGQLVGLALSCRKDGNIGIAFTYNEPLIGWEYVLDAAKIAHRNGLKTVLVSNGTTEREILLKILPYIDAMNIDMKGFSEDFYSGFIHGDFEMVKAFIEMAVSGAEGIPGCHVEITTLLIPGLNDMPEMMREEARWIASLDDGKGEVPLHVTRYFPRYHCEIPATPVDKVYGLADEARKYLRYVYTGNC